MNTEHWEIRRELRMLEHAEHSGKISKRADILALAGQLSKRWRKAYLERGEARL